MRQFKAGSCYGRWLKQVVAKRLKSLICMRFESHPEFVWITLLISGPDSPPALENQGSGWNARKKSKVQNPYKSMT
jgi:hypothetical protein